MQAVPKHMAPSAPAAAALAALAATVAAGAVAWRHGASPETIEFGAAIVALAVAAVRDCEERVIPNACVAALLAVRAAYLFVGLAAGFATVGDVARSIVGAVAVGGGLLAMALVLDRALRTNSIGGGDVKLLMASGAYFGLEGGGAVVLLACIIGLAGSRLHNDGDGRFAFGPAIALAFGLVMAAS